ncbi:MAG: hypothetical protein ACLFTH_00590 [Candidatus Woesearchaeota archaeon]
MSKWVPIEHAVRSRCDDLRPLLDTTAWHESTHRSLRLTSSNETGS